MGLPVPLRFQDVMAADNSVNDKLRLGECPDNSPAITSWSKMPPSMLLSRPSPTRRRAILARLAVGEATVMEIAAPFAMTQPAVSRHLSHRRFCGYGASRGAADPCPWGAPAPTRR
jgi:hypothetical protein